MLTALVAMLKISIHAPAKGATKSGKVYTNNNGISIHAPVKGAAGNRRTCVHRTRDFNPRSREGSDGAVATPGVWRACFNPRSREGSDSDGSSTYNSVVLVSIHAPAKGATLWQHCQQRHRRNFNPRSREGSDPGLCAWSGCSVYFNPRSREGSDAPPRQVGAPIRFQSTLP